MENKDIVAYCVDSIKKAGADHAQCLLQTSEKNELNVDAGEFSLFRTTFNSSLQLTALKDQQKGSLSINKTDKESIQSAVKQVMELASSSPPDPAHAIADQQPANTFNIGYESPNLDMMYDRLQEYLEYVKATYPAIIMEQSLFDFTRSQSYYQNSNQVDFLSQKGMYAFWTFFTAKEGKQSSSFNYTGYYGRNIDQELSKYSTVDKLLKQTSEQIITKPIPGKFEGDVIITPDCVEDIVGFITSYLGDSSMIKGNSIFKDRLGDMIATDLLTLHSNPTSDDIENGYFVTPDGFEAKNCTIIDKGVLKTFLLSLYGANKTGKERASNPGGAYIIEPGDTPLDDMIKSVKRGIILQRFSGGNPNDNGEFSGVAKNSYYVEDGEIRYPLVETMISGNLADLLKSIKSVSKERINFGICIYPWIQTGGITIS